MANTNFPTWGDVFRATDWVFSPTEWVRQSPCYECLHEKVHVVAKVALTPLAFVDGAIKVPVFALAAPLGVIAFPIYAMAEGGYAHLCTDPAKRAKHHARAELGWKMALISLAAVAGIVAFAMISVYIIPMWMAVASVIAAVGLSIGITVYRVWHHNTPNNDSTRAPSGPPPSGPIEIV